jgi:hypothetical protein
MVTEAVGTSLGLTISPANRHAIHLAFATLAAAPVRLSQTRRFC